VLVQETRGNYFPHRINIGPIYCGMRCNPAGRQAPKMMIDEHAFARTNLEEFEVLGLALTLCSQLGYAIGKLVPLLLFQIQRLHDSFLFTFHLKPYSLGEKEPNVPLLVDWLIQKHPLLQPQMHVCRNCICSANLAAEKPDMCAPFHSCQASGKVTTSKHIPGIRQQHISLRLSQCPMLVGIF